MISSFLRRVMDTLLSRAFWVCVGFLIIAVLIWFVGPLFAIGDSRPLVSVGAKNVDDCCTGGFSADACVVAPLAPWLGQCRGDGAPA